MKTLKLKTFFLIGLSALFFNCFSQKNNTLTSSWDRNKEIHNHIPYRVGNKWGFSDTSGKIIIAVKYDRAELFQRGYSIVKTGSKMKLIDTMGKEMNAGLYDSIEYEQYTWRYKGKNITADNWKYLTGKEEIQNNSNGMFPSGPNVIAASDDFDIIIPEISNDTF